MKTLLAILMLTFGFTVNCQAAVNIFGKYCGDMQVTKAGSEQPVIVKNCWTFELRPDFSILNTYVDLMDGKTYTNIIKYTSPSFIKILGLRDPGLGLDADNLYAGGTGHCEKTADCVKCLDYYSPMDNVESGAELVIIYNDKIDFSGTARAKDGTQYAFKGIMYKLN